MTADQQTLITTLSPLLSPVAIAFFGWWIKGQLSKVEKISELLFEMKRVGEKISELNVRMEKLEDTREQVILMKNEMKTMWSRHDELRRSVLASNN